MKKSVNQLIWESKKSGKPVNPWAICTTSVGRKDKDKYERCIMDVKKKSPIKENKLNEIGGYDDPNMFAKHAGSYLDEVKETYNTMSQTLNNLDKLSREVLDDTLRRELESFLKSMVDPFNKLAKSVVNFEKKNMGQLRGGKPTPRDLDNEN